MANWAPVRARPIADRPMRTLPFRRSDVAARRIGGQGDDHDDALVALDEAGCDNGGASTISIDNP